MTEFMLLASVGLVRTTAPFLSGRAAASASIAIVAALLTFSGCVSSYFGRFTLAPTGAREAEPGVPPQTVSDATVARVSDVVGEVAGRFSMKKRPDISEDLQQRISRMGGFRSVAQYEYLPEGEARSILLSVTIAQNRSSMEVVIRDLGRSEEVDLTRGLREQLQTQLVNALPDYEVRFESGRVDASFAP